MKITSLPLASRKSSDTNSERFEFSQPCLRPPPLGNLLLWLSADTGLALDPIARVISWDNRQPGIPPLAQPDSNLRPIVVANVFNGFPDVQFSDGTFLDVQNLGITGADFTLFVVGRTLSEQSPGTGGTGRRFVFQQTLSRNIQGDTRPFLVAISTGSNGAALYEFNLDTAPLAVIPADMSVLCPLTIAWRESLPVVTLCSQPLAQPSTVTGYQLGMPSEGNGGNNGFDGIIVELLLYQGTLGAADRTQAEAYLQEKYQCCESSSSSDSSDSSSSESSDLSSSDSSSSDSSSSESSDSSSSVSSSSSSDSSSSESSDSSSSESSSDSSSSESSDSSSSESSESSSSESSDSSESSCSLVLPPDPTPVTDGLAAWYRSDLNITKDGNQITAWGAVCDCLPDAVSIGGTPPLYTDGAFGVYSGISFDSQAGLQIQGGELAENSFTIFVIGRATGERLVGGPGTAEQRLLFYQDGDFSNAYPSVSAGRQTIGIYEYGPSEHARVTITADAEVLCPLVIRYESKQLSIWLRGERSFLDTSAPSYALRPAHFIGGTGDVNSGFIGTLAEIIIYNRALSDYERHQVENYLQSRYGCLPVSSDSSASSAESSSDSSNSESSDSSSSDSSDSSSSESSESSDSESSDSSSSESSDSSFESESSEQSDSSDDSSSSPKGEIMRDEDEANDDWKRIQGQLAKALPGQRINLHFEPPAGTTITNYHWILPDTVFYDYTGGKAKGELKPRNAIVIDQQEVYFYWADSGTKVVRVQYKQDGIAIESEVTIEVAKPTAALTGTDGDSVINFRPDYNTIENLFVPRIDFTGSVSIPADFGNGGKWWFVQLVTVNCSAKRDPTDDDPPAAKQDGGTYFDGIEYPYSGEIFSLGMQGGTYDDPGIPLTTAYRQYTADLYFVMYIMFTPPGTASKQVPLMSLIWSWSDAARDVAVHAPPVITPPIWEQEPEQSDPRVAVENATDNTAHPQWDDSSDHHFGLVVR